MRGYQKRVVYLKNIGSALFEEAYFVIKPRNEKHEKGESEPDLINEANRIVEESVSPYKRKRSAIGLKDVIFFISGFLLSSLIYFLIL